MDRIAVISDVHGNLEALKTTLKDIENRNIKTIYCLGDTISKGHHPHKCIELIRKHCKVVLKGNTDENNTKDHHVFDCKESEDLYRWNQSLMTKEDIEYIKNLPFCFEQYISGSFVRFFHASPHKINYIISEHDQIDRKFELFKPSPYTNDQYADIAVYGHLHIQYLGKIYNRTMVNCGSVGNAGEVVHDQTRDAAIEETRQVHYLIIEGTFDSKERESISFQFVKLPYDYKKELNDLELNIFPDLYKKEIEYGVYRDQTKLCQSFKERNIKLPNILDK